MKLRENQHLNSLLVKAGIPQLRVFVLPGGAFVYVENIPGSPLPNNYQRDLPRVDVESRWSEFNKLGGQQ